MSTVNTGRDLEISSSVKARLLNLRHFGDVTEGDARAQDCQLIATAHGAESANDHINLWLSVDRMGIVRDARFRSAATGVLLASYDVMSELCLGKKLIEIVTITPRQVEAQLRQASPEPAFELGDDADLPYYVLTKAAERGNGIPPAAPNDPGSVTSGCQPPIDWPRIGLFEKVRRIESVLDQHVRPALASDGGGIDLVDLKDQELMVQYHGACGSCSSSIGGTLQFIQDSLNNHLGTNLQVKVSAIENQDMFNL